MSNNCYRIVAKAFGGPEVFEVVDEPLPEPGPRQVRVRVTSIGMNHADLMARRGEYKLSSGEPPFTPGLEAGGVVDAVGEGVTAHHEGDRVVLSLAVSHRAGDGSYRSHFVCDASEAIPAPAALPDDQLGAVWLPYFTAWGCLVFRQQLKPGQVVALPAASSSVALAAAQVVKDCGGIAIGLTTSADKVDRIRALDASMYDHMVVTDRSDPRGWYKELKQITEGRGVDVFFDPVASGDYLSTEIRSLATGGTIWVYGLLGAPGPVDVSPLIVKDASIRGWLLGSVAQTAPDEVRPIYEAILERFERGVFRQHVAASFPLREAARAHDVMERGDHIGKLVLVP